MTTTPLPPPALWHDQTTGQWKVLTKPDRPTYEAYYTAEQVHQARSDLEAENKRLREALEKLTHYAECQVAAFSSGRPSLDMTLFPHLCANARAALKEQP